MTILIPYYPDIFDGLELGYALRSIEKNLNGWTNVILIGKPPAWYKGDYVNAQDYAGRKQYTIYSKLLTGCELNNVTDNFIMWNDDHFLLRSLDVSDIKYWHNGKLSDELKRDNIYPRYKNTVTDTLAIMPEALNYDIHVPIKYNTQLFKFLFQNKTTEICIKSYYCNCHKELDKELMSDCKIDQLLSKEAIYELIKDKLFFSTNVNAIKAPMRSVLSELFPEKSQWEK